MRALFVLLAGLLICGCIYDVPLAEKAEIPVDSALKGLWQMIPDEGEPEDPDDRLLILLLSDTEYIAVVDPSEDALYFRAWSVRVGESEVIQLKWLNRGDGGSEYTVSRYVLKDGVLTVDYLNEDLVGSKIKDSAALRVAFAENLDNPELFELFGRFRRLKD
jgi:hypothetical protein